MVQIKLLSRNIVLQFNIYTPEGSRRRWEDNIKLDLQEMEWGQELD
jgi:hypothetical protein